MSAPSPSPVSSEKRLEPQREQDLVEESTLRYAAYSQRLAFLFKTGTRYLAYTSEVGESLRPVVAPSVVRAAYAISWMYVFGDVANEGRKAYQHDLGGADLARVVTQRAVFQSLASMALPAFAIHTQVRIFGMIFMRLNRFQRWGPTLSGFALLPVLPAIFDHPVENAVEWAYGRVWPVKQPDHAYWKLHQHMLPEHTPASAAAASTQHSKQE